MELLTKMKKHYLDALVLSLARVLKTPNLDKFGAD